MARLWGSSWCQQQFSPLILSPMTDLSTSPAAHTGSKLTKHIISKWGLNQNRGNIHLISDSSLTIHFNSIRRQDSRLPVVLTSNQPKSLLFYSELCHIWEECLAVSRCLHAVLCVYIFVSSNEAGNEVGSGGRWDVNKYYITQHVPPPPDTYYKGGRRKLNINLL